MTQPRPRPASDSVFDAAEEVIQSHPLLGHAPTPRFGDTIAWDLNDVIRRPARLPACAWTLQFTDELAHPTWNLLAREVSMILFNPRHPAVTAAGLSLKPRPAHPTTVIGQISHVRRLVRWADSNDLSPHLANWSDNDLRRFVGHLRQQLSDNSIRQHIGTLKMLHQFGPALTDRGLRTDPWAGKSSRRAAAALPAATVTTPVIPPEQWFPLIRAAWTYVHTFAPDILRAQRRYQTLRDEATTQATGCDSLLDRWLTDPANPIPIHAGSHHRPAVHWSLLALLIGWNRTAATTVFNRSRTAGCRRRIQVERAIVNGHSTITGVIDDLTVIEHSDGTISPWHPGLAPRAIAHERLMLRDACYVLVVGLSMMRDSEIHEIARDCLVDHYGTPAIKSTKGKHDPNLPIKHWWITAPVAEAVVVAEQLSEGHDKLFPPLRRTDADVSRSHQMLDLFTAHVNAITARTGLHPIPAGRARPHMFRRTMAMLTDQFPGSEIALGIQLKHIASRALANRSTQGYAAADNSWADHLESALDAARFRRIEELYHAHKDGQPIGFGPGADRIAKEFTTIQDTVQARNGDAAVERAMLRSARLSIRFGVLNHCAMDENNPAGAACLDNAVIPAGHKGPLQDRCRPDRCANSIIAPEHLPIWATERHTLLTLLATPGIASGRKALLHRELADVDAVLNRAVPLPEDQWPLQPAKASPTTPPNCCAPLWNGCSAGVLSARTGGSSRTISGRKLESAARP